MDAEGSAPGRDPTKEEKRIPSCGRCRNHGITVPLKGHKKSCPYQNCMLDCCILNHRRKHVMAAQNAVSKNEQGPVQLIATQPAYHQLPPTPPPSSCDVTNSDRNNLALEEHEEAADQLMRHYKLDAKAIPFVYALFNLAGNLERARQLIDEAKKDLPASWEQYSEEIEIARAAALPRLPLLDEEGTPSTSGESNRAHLASSSGANNSRTDKTSR